MYKFKISTVAPFWAKNNDNKPSLDIFNNWINENMQEVDNLNINFLSFQNITINTQFNGIKYLQIINMDDPNDTRYYYCNQIEITGSNNTYRFNAVIDVYASYTLKFIEQNKNKELVFLRTHNYNKKALQIEDSTLQSLPKLYNNFYFSKVLFNYDKESGVWYGNKTGLKGNDLLNANKYFVFKDGPNGGYKFYPICSKALNATFYYEEQVKGGKIYEGDFWNGRSINYTDNYNNLKVEIPAELNNAIISAYENNDIIEYNYRQVNYGYKFPAHTVWLGDWKVINNVPYGTLPVDISAYNISGNNAGAGLRYIDYNINLLGNTVYHSKHTNITSSKFGDINRVRDDGRLFKVRIYKNNPIKREKLIKNSFVSLDEFRRREENINKFLGIFYLPHLFNFNKWDFDGDYLYITINPVGDKIGLYNIFNYNLSNITDKLNNSTYSTPYLLKYLNIKYYGVPINAEYRVNDMNKVFIGGKIFFTDTCNIISKSDDLISLDKSIISFPYQLPIGVDTYEQYVKANRNVTDTGFAIEKQKENMNIAKALFGGAMGIVGAGAKAASGNFVGAATSAINSIAETTFGMIGQIQGMQQLENKIKSQYEQANMTMGNNIQFSNIANAALTEYYDSENEQYEGVEVSDLDENSLVQINNFIFFNGYLLPQKDTLSNRLDQNRKFNFIQIDAQLLISIVNINYNQNQLNNEIYDLIVQQLSNGIRIWNENIDNVDLPTYDPNEPWPDQPSDNRPVIPPEQAPVPDTPPEPTQIVDINDYVGIGNYNKMPVNYFDNSGNLRTSQCFIIFSKNRIVQSNVVAGNEQNIITEFTDKAYFMWCSSDMYNEYIFAAKSGGTEKINIKLGGYNKERWEQIKLKDFTTGGVSQYTNNLIEIEAIAGINVYDANTDEFIGEINFTNE